MITEMTIQKGDNQHEPLNHQQLRPLLPAGLDHLPVSVLVKSRIK
jgi:hypothetical protein